MWLYTVLSICTFPTMRKSDWNCGRKTIKILKHKIKFKNVSLASVVMNEWVDTERRPWSTFAWDKGASLERCKQHLRQ